MIMIKKIFGIILILLCAVSFYGCKMIAGSDTISKDNSLEIIVKGKSFTLAWDSGGPEIPNDPNKTVQYNIYYRAHGLLYWNFLTTVKSKRNPDCQITNKILDYGRYDFAVKAVNGKGEESAFHSSLDATANPFTGWYVNWIGSN